MDAPTKSALPETSARTATRVAVRCPGKKLAHRRCPGVSSASNSLKLPGTGEVPSPKTGSHHLATRLSQYDWVERLRWQAEVFGMSFWRT